MMAPDLLLFSLLAGHALADYPLQGDFLARAKSRTAPIPGVPWWQALTAHAAIHGVIVAMLTGNTVLGIAEMAVHWHTDDLKCRGKIGFNTDQAIHVVCKLLWFGLAVSGAA